MKKLLIALFSAAILTGCASSIYEIDPAATASAQWSVGEIIATDTPIYDDKEQQEIVRVFLGITPEGRYLVQEFYDLDKGIKYSDPFLIINYPTISSPFRQITYGKFTLYYSNGKTLFTCTFSEKGSIKPCIGLYEDGVIISKSTFTFVDGQVGWALKSYYRNGQPKSQFEYNNQEIVRPMLSWDENGNLISEEY